LLDSDSRGTPTEGNYVLNYSEAPLKSVRFPDDGPSEKLLQTPSPSGESTIAPSPNSGSPIPTAPAFPSSPRSLSPCHQNLSADPLIHTVLISIMLHAQLDDHGGLGISEMELWSLFNLISGLNPIKLSTWESELQKYSAKAKPVRIDPIVMHAIQAA